MEYGYGNLIVFLFLILPNGNFGIPPLMPKADHGIVYPEDNWDHCVLDHNGSQQQGQCVNVDNCLEVLIIWQKQNIYPKTCYFLKQELFVCCPKSTPLSGAETVTVKTTENTMVANSTKLSFLELLKMKHRKSELECDLNTRAKLFVVHGTATKTDEFPFMAALGWNSSFDAGIWYRCGGVVISPRFVLTAAHCADIGGDKASVVRIGGSNLTDVSVRDVKIKRFIQHPGYKASEVYNDIALVELDEEVKDVYAACLWLEDNLDSENFIATGYGHTTFGGLGSNQLLKVDLKAVTNKACSEFYPAGNDGAPNGITSTQLCAHDPEKLRDTCQGDSGGPLILQRGISKRGYVVGITSFGLGCAGGAPGIYTRVSSYLDWIEPIVWPKLDTRSS
ncbi:serine protease snake isoform X2 [Stomoxys calcitrans]|uniref:Peptidase S1 domain-containing protein n=1 Tax=Stomoxys calcitrans TaxID=35570 RepID=A0A1I8P467_STOCA|nr:serine protease snake isoform X2 [Stomoxys calcitrans]